MKYSRNKLNNTGEVLISQTKDLIRYSEALTLVEDWRRIHQVPMHTLFESVADILNKAEISPAFSSQRLKRMTSIIGKLQHNPEMRLGGVQDIAGVRFVFEDISSLSEAAKILEESNLPDFTFERSYNYVSSPKGSGYRSIHYVYKYHSDDEQTDGLRVELQIRTRLQHDWATAVETAELISKSPLKANMGDEGWLSFLKLVSAIFAKAENGVVLDRFRDYTEERYCKEYAAMDNEHHYLAQLDGLISAVSFVGVNAFDQGYALLFTNFEQNQVYIKHYPEGSFAEANTIYSQMEGNLDSSKGAVVLVSVRDMNELREAYSSYFMNARDFVASLHSFINKCKVNGYI